MAQCELDGACVVIAHGEYGMTSLGRRTVFTKSWSMRGVVGLGVERVALSAPSAGTRSLRAIPPVAAASRGRSRGSSATP
ncbi:hypothetical protein [Streptomyces sp. NBC_00035]|uniref:hypothetical protein n=1 Tax=Streptomyces sp. NBC_00035 TaxID=2903614 RepID=UPI003243B7A3